MTMIVTGAGGFIGSNLVAQLNEAGYEDLVLVDSYDNADCFRNLGVATFDDIWHQDDLFVKLPAVHAQQPVKAIFHLGANSSTAESDGAYLLKNNIEYSKRLITWAVDNSVPIIYASSASVYGNGDNGFREDPSCEDPLNGYAFSKKVVDDWVRKNLEVWTAQGAQVVGLRYFNVYGPNEVHKLAMKMCSPVMHFHNQIQSEGQINVFAGSDGFLRDFVLVNDCCALNLWLYDHPQVSGILNCGTGTARSFAQVAEQVQANYEGATINEVPFPDHLKGKYQAYTQADLSNLRAVGCDLAFQSLEDGIAYYVRMLKEHAGYRR